MPRGAGAPRSWSASARGQHVATDPDRLRPLAPGAARPAPQPQPHPRVLSELPLPKGVTFTVKFNGRAVYGARTPGTEVDGTALQHSRLAGVSLGRSHQHADPAEGKGEAVQSDSSLSSSLPRPLGQGLAGGWGRCPLGCIYISEDATDARGTGWSQVVPMCRCH